MYIISVGKSAPGTRRRRLPGVRVSAACHTARQLTCPCPVLAVSLYHYRVHLVMQR